MGSIFKQSVSRPIPADSEIVTKDGRPFARWRVHGKLRTAPLSEDGTRIVTKSSTYYGRFRDASGVVVTRSTGCRDEQAARQLLATWMREVEQIHAGTLDPQKLKTAKLSSEPVERHFLAYEHHQMAKQVNVVYLKNTMAALRRIAADCEFLTLANLDVESFERWLLVRAGEGMAARTRNGYREAWIVFANWCTETGRLSSNPFGKLPLANVKTDRRRERRALTESELDRLLAVARDRALNSRQRIRKDGSPAKLSPDYREKMERNGRERALIYKLYVLTGLRFNELRSLTLGSVLLGDSPRIVLSAANEKNRKGAIIPLRVDLAEDLKAHLDDRLNRLKDAAKTKGELAPSALPLGSRLLAVPLHLVRHLTKDLAAAGIPKVDERGYVVDVHGLRHTFNTLLAKGGVHQRVAQELMRHSDPRLTANAYTHLRISDTTGALDALPKLSLTGLKSNLVTLPVTSSPDPKGHFLSIAGKRERLFECCSAECNGSKMASNVHENGPVTTAVITEPHSQSRSNKVAAIGFEPMTSRL